MANTLGKLLNGQYLSDVLSHSALILVLKSSQKSYQSESRLGRSSDFTSQCLVCVSMSLEICLDFYFGLHFLEFPVW